MAEPPDKLVAALEKLGLLHTQSLDLARDLARLATAEQEAILEMGRASGTRAGEAMRTAADALRLLPVELGVRALARCRERELNQALAVLRGLSDLGGRFHPQVIAAWLKLAAGLRGGPLLEWAERSPRELAALKVKATQILALRLIALLPGNPVDSLRLISGSLRKMQKPGALLGMALAVARVSPAGAAAWLATREEGPSGQLSPAAIWKWMRRGMSISEPERYFAGLSRESLNFADRLAGVVRLSGEVHWLAPYLSVHAGRALEIQGHLPHDPLRFSLEQDEGGQLHLPASLGLSRSGSLLVFRCLGVLGAWARSLGMYDLDPGELSTLLENGGYRPPVVHQLSPVALFGAAFPNRPRALEILSLVTEAGVRGRASACPGLEDSFVRLDKARLENPPPFFELEPVDAVLKLMGYFLWGGSDPPGAPQPAGDLALRLAKRVTARAGERDALGVYALAMNIYRHLDTGRPGPAPMMPQNGQQPALDRQAAVDKGLAPPAARNLGKGASGPRGDSEAALNWAAGEGGKKEEVLDSFWYPEWDPGQGRVVPKMARVLARRPKIGDPT